MSHVLRVTKALENLTEASASVIVGYTGLPSSTVCSTLQHMCKVGTARGFGPRNRLIYKLTGKHPKLPSLERKGRFSIGDGHVDSKAVQRC